MHSFPFITFISSVYRVVLRDWKVLFKSYKNGFLAVLFTNLCDVNIHYEDTKWQGKIDGITLKSS